MTGQDRKTAEEIVAKAMPLCSPTGEALVEEIAAALSAARGRWIPVGERLPEGSGYYLVCGPRINHVLAAKWYPAESVWSHGLVEHAVTHWRELPEPPQEGGSNG